ncbi:MAG: DUF4202 domain-containing protein [Gammaproteobacteria bacterium]
MSDEKLQRVLDLIDEANAQDPNADTDQDGNSFPKEWLYGRRMTDMLTRFSPAADAVQQIACRAQHIERWKSPRSDYPMDKKGYHLWRTRLYSFHADTVAGLMESAGYDAESIERVKQAVGKKALKKNPDTQMLENIAAMTFIEHYMHDFAGQHPEYSEDKWITIIQKTWKKMDESAHAFVLGGNVKLPEPLVPLIQKALAA